MKFHAFFRKVLVNGEVLGKVVIGRRNTRIVVLLIIICCCGYSPELVTRYQLYKCSKRRKKCGHSYITRCRFGFPRPVCANAALNPAATRFTRTESEVRVNDYNPFLLMLLKANMDIQFIAEAY